MFENPRRGSQARNFGENVPKIVDLKSSSEQIFSENCRWVPLIIGRTTATTTTNQLNLINRIVFASENLGLFFQL